MRNAIWWCHSVLIMLISSVMLGGCHSNPPLQNEPQRVADRSQGDQDPGVVVDLREPRSLSGLIDVLQDNQVVYLGEQHDRFEQHLMQAQLIKALHQRNPKLVVAMEQFQRPFQKVLDQYVQGSINEADMLKQSDWYGRWRYDFRLYRPILNLIRERQIPVLALNADAELTHRVREVGLVGLEPAERDLLPVEMVQPDGEYLESLMSVFELHSGREKRSFERFLEVQMAWDETMAEGIVRVLEADPNAQLVVLVGSGHVQYDWGIPSRVERRVPAVSQAVVMQADGAAGEGVDPEAADWLINVPSKALPAKGSIGMLMMDTDSGVLVSQVIPESGGDQAGLEKNDHVVALNGYPIRTTVDVRIHLLDKEPGDEVSMTVERGQDGGTTTKYLLVKLKGLNSQHGKRHVMPMDRVGEGEGRYPHAEK